MELIKEREKVAAFMQRLYQQKLTTATGGNVSMRIGDRVLITPSQIDKAKVTGEQVVILALDGQIINQRHKKSMESEMHLAIYLKRPDVKAVVHAHPVYATSFAVAGKSIKTNLTGESWYIVGEPELVSYELMGTTELASKVADASLRSDAILLQNHGIITIGENLFQAYDRMEVLEACARMTFITGYLGNDTGLSYEQLNKIDELKPKAT
jgi:L-fuculose-phosphate aldolase